MESPFIYVKFKLLFTSSMMLLTGCLLAIVKQNTSDMNNIAPANTIHWTDLLTSVYNDDRFEKILGAVDRSSHNFSAMVPSTETSKQKVTFLPQVHFIEQFRPTVDELAVQFERENGTDFGDFIHKKILEADPLAVNRLARILEVYNSQLAIYDQLSRAVQSLKPGQTIDIFVESMQYTQLARVGIPTASTMGPFLIKNGASELVKILYPNQVNLIGTELMEQHSLAKGQVDKQEDSLILKAENLGGLYYNCIHRFKSELILYESKCYRLLVMRQREANAVAVVKNHMQDSKASFSFLIFGAAHPMTMYSEEKVAFQYAARSDMIQANSPLLSRQLEVLSGLNKLLFEQNLVFKDFRTTKKFTLALATALLKNRIKSEDLSQNRQPSINYQSDNISKNPVGSKNHLAL